MRGAYAAGSTRAVTKRTCVKVIRFSAEELRIVVERACAAGRPVACYVREAAQGASPRARKAEMNDSVIRLLSRIGNRLHELSREANDNRLSCAADFGQAVGEVLEIIRALE